MNKLIKLIFGPFDRKRAHISDLGDFEPIRLSETTRLAASKFASDLGSEFEILKELDRLLEEPVVDFDRERHLMLQMPEMAWLNDGKELIVLFSRLDDKPICAYFKDLADPNY